MKRQSVYLHDFHGATKAQSFSKRLRNEQPVRAVVLLSNYYVKHGFWSTRLAFNKNNRVLPCDINVGFAAELDLLLRLRMHGRLSP